MSKSKSTKASRETRVDQPPVLANEAARATEAEQQRAHERFMVRWSVGANITKHALTASAVVFTALAVFYFPVTVAPGETTVVKLTQNFLAQIHAHVWVAWGLAGGSYLAYRREKKERLKERQEKDARLRTFEKEQDAKVTSSGLNLDGTKTKGELR